MKKRVVKQKFEGYIFYPLIFPMEDKEVVYEGFSEFSDLSKINLITPETRGISPFFRIRSFSSSICNENFENCSHENGKEYYGKRCQPLMENWEIIDFAIVSKPEHPKALISDVIIVEHDQGRTKYTWQGFRDSDENGRFKRIQRLQTQRIISEQAAKFFSRFFSINPEGTAVYPKI
jgi:hypothetical protein